MASVALEEVMHIHIQVHVALPMNDICKVELRGAP